MISTTRCGRQFAQSPVLVGMCQKAVEIPGFMLSMLIVIRQEDCGRRHMDSFPGPELPQDEPNVAEWLLPHLCLWSRTISEGIGRRRPAKRQSILIPDDVHSTPKFWTKMLPWVVWNRRQVPSHESDESRASAEIVDIQGSNSLPCCWGYTPCQTIDALANCI